MLSARWILSGLLFSLKTTGLFTLDYSTSPANAFPSCSKFGPFEKKMNTPAPSNDPPSSAPDNETPAPPVLDTDPVAAPPSTELPKICLDQFLKTCGVETGGQAKRLIQGGEVLVNNELETRRRRKLVPGDEVQLYDDVFVVALAESVELETPDAEPSTPAESE